MSAVNKSPQQTGGITVVDADEDHVAFHKMPKAIRDFLMYEMPFPTSSIEVLQEYNRSGQQGLLMRLVNGRRSESRWLYGGNYPSIGLFKIHDQVKRRAR